MNPFPQLPVSKQDGTWGIQSIEVINAVLREHYQKPPEEILKIARAAYPFGERNYHPYKVWCKKISVLKELLMPKEPESIDTPLFGVIR